MHSWQHPSPNSNLHAIVIPHLYMSEFMPNTYTGVVTRVTRLVTRVFHTTYLHYPQRSRTINWLRTEGNRQDASPRGLRIFFPCLALRRVSAGKLRMRERVEFEFLLNPDLHSWFLAFWLFGFLSVYQVVDFAPAGKILVHSEVEVHTVYQRHTKVYISTD